MPQPLRLNFHIVGEVILCKWIRNEPTNGEMSPNFSKQRHRALPNANRISIVLEVCSFFGLPLGTHTPRGKRDRVASAHVLCIRRCWARERIFAARNDDANSKFAARGEAKGPTDTALCQTKTKSKR